MSRSSIAIRAAVVAALSGGVLLPVGASAQESAESYPSKDVKLVCAFPAGSGADVYVRYFAEKLKPIMKQTVIVENRVGAAGNIATTYTARAKPDGYTIYIHAPSSLAANMHLFKKPPVDIRKEIQIVSALNQQPFMLAVASNSPAKTYKELVAILKKKGDKASYATSNPTNQISSFLFKQALGIKPVEVPYRTAMETVNDMMSGRIDFAFHDPVSAIAQRNAGKLRLFGVTTIERVKALPDMPTMDELGIKGFDVPGWWAAMVPAATPKPIVAKLNKIFVQVAESKETVDFFAKFGADAISSTPEAGQKRLIEDVDRWGKNIAAAGIPKRG
ncbi:MAG: Bug family tripartite tricarboxylate transporter substrate binding protein [Hyphomicrobiaceae bacterium]